MHELGQAAHLLVVSETSILKNGLAPKIYSCLGVMRLRVSHLTNIHLYILIYTNLYRAETEERGERVGERGNGISVL